MKETTDVVIVGGRCAGSAAAIALAKRGRSVIALDRATFPSDTLSTHLFFPHHWAELERLGARERVMALDPPLHTRAMVATPEVEVQGPFDAYEGFAAGACVRRAGLDMALVETARDAGAEIRERTRVTGLVRDRTGRVTGVHWERRGEAEGTIGASLVIGADGRNSTVARLVGAEKHHEWANRRMMAYAYYEDHHDELRHLAAQWRDGTDLVTVFPCDGGQSVVLLMPPTSQADEFRADPEAVFDKTVTRVAPLAERIADCRRVSKVRLSATHPSYFRRSWGPGWALAGDSGHFKDPVTAQGIRDAWRFGRLLGEAAAPVLDDPVALDRALAEYEADRDDQCLPMYQWSNRLGLDDEVSPFELAAYRWFASRPDGPTEVLRVFSRLSEPTEVFSPTRLLWWVAAAFTRRGADRRHLASVLRRDIGREVDRIREARTFARRRDRTI